MLFCPKKTAIQHRNLFEAAHLPISVAQFFIIPEITPSKQIVNVRNKYDVQIVISVVSNFINPFVTHCFCMDSCV